MGQTGIFINSFVIKLVKDRTQHPITRTCLCTASDIVFCSFYPPHGGEDHLITAIPDMTESLMFLVTVVQLRYHLCGKCTQTGQFWTVCLIVVLWVITEVLSFLHCFREIPTHGLCKHRCGYGWTSQSAVFDTVFLKLAHQYQHSKNFLISTYVISDHSNSIYCHLSNKWLTC